MRTLRTVLELTAVVLCDLARAAEPAANMAAMPEKQGYWWKAEPPPEQKNAPESKYQPLLAPPDEAALLAMHPKQVEELIEAYRQNAVWQGTTETVKWYYELQDFGRRRARAFMNVTEVVMLQSPELNMQTVYPTNPVGQQARVAQRSASMAERLAAESGRAALVLLSRQSCPYCEEQRKILNYFHAKHGWDIREIDIDAQPEVAKRFAATYTPTTVVVFRDSPQWAPVSVGVETLERVEEGVYRALRLVRGEVAPDQYSLQEFNDGGLYDPRRSAP
jgi:conjugal transfer pilus assembly protein TraF